MNNLISENLKVMCLYASNKMRANFFCVTNFSSPAAESSLSAALLALGKVNMLHEAQRF